MIRYIFPLTIIILCAGCSSHDVLPEINSTKPGYKVVFMDENVVIQEKFLGSKDTWDWDEFVMPDARIAFSDHHRMAMSEKFYECYDQFQIQKSCGFSVNTPTNVNEFRFDKIFGGNCEIYNNGMLIWTGHMNGGTDLSIASITVLGDGLVVDYTDVDNKTADWFILDSILYIESNSVVDYVLDNHYTTAYAPFVIKGELAFFAEKNGDLLLVLDGQETKLGYERIFNQLCCWDGPPIQISGNDETLDFFAQKDGGWYHVQATRK